MKKIKIGIFGPNGRMGKNILEQIKNFNELNYPARPRWPLDEKATFLKGAGVKL